MCLSQNKIPKCSLASHITMHHFQEFSLFPQRLWELGSGYSQAVLLVAAKLWGSYLGLLCSWKTITSKLTLSKDGEQRKCCLCHPLILIHPFSFQRENNKSTQSFTDHNNQRECFCMKKKWPKAYKVLLPQ